MAISFSMLGKFSTIIFSKIFSYPFFSLVGQTVKHLPMMWEIWVQSLGQEDTLEKEMATHSSTLAWKIPWTEDPGRLWSMGLQRQRPSPTKDAETCSSYSEADSFEKTLMLGRVEDRRRKG